MTLAGILDFGEFEVNEPGKQSSPCEQSWEARLEWVIGTLQHWSGALHELVPGTARKRTIADAVALLDREVQGLGELLSLHAHEPFALESITANVIEARLQSVVDATQRLDRMMRHQQGASGSMNEFATRS